MDPLERLAGLKLPLAELLGIVFVSASKERVVAEMTVRPELCTRPAVLHGGALMALADTVGAAGTVLNLPEGAWTTTLESKTNFIGAAAAGSTVTATARPLHLGGRTQIWETRVTAADGKLLALVTQTQLVLPKRT